MGVAITVQVRRITDWTVKVAEEGLLFTRVRVERLIEWERLTNVFCWTSLGVLAAIDEEGYVSLGIILKDSVLGSVGKKVKEIWQKWDERIQDKSSINCFIYPNWCRDKDKQSFNWSIIWGIGGGIFFLIVLLAMLAKGGWDIGDVGLFPLVGGALVCLIAFWHGFYGLFRRLGKNFDEIHVLDDNIEILYEDGSTRAFKITDIRKYRLTNPWNIGTIVFKDGTTLRDVERVSYWPVLRGYLLTRVDPLGKSLIML